MSEGSQLNVILGSGPIGLAVARQLSSQGKPVRIVNRSGRAAAPEGVEVVAADVMDERSRTAAVEGSTAVFNCMNPPYTKWPELFPALQQAAIEAAVAADAKLIVAENMYGYGHIDGPMTEDTPLRATTKKGAVRAQMTKDLMEAHNSDRVQAAAARGSDYFGPRGLNSMMGERVFYPMLAGKKVSMLGSVEMPPTYTYLDDFGKALVILSERDEALGHVWHVPNAETLTTRQFLEIAFEQAEAEPRIGTMPKIMVRVAGLFARDIREVLEMIYEFEEPFVVDSSKFTSQFGIEGTPIREALTETIRWFRDNPKT